MVQHYVCKIARIAAFANAETARRLLRPDFCAFKYLLIKFSLQRHPDHSVRDPNPAVSLHLIFLSLTRQGCWNSSKKFVDG